MMSAVNENPEEAMLRKFFQGLLESLSTKPRVYSGNNVSVYDSQRSLTPRFQTKPDTRRKKGTDPSAFTWKKQRRTPTT